LLTGEFSQGTNTDPTNTCFNPHPSLLTGELFMIHAPWTYVSGFNPHPSLLTGELGQVPALPFVEIVSIRTRHC